MLKISVIEARGVPETVKAPLCSVIINGLKQSTEPARGFGPAPKWQNGTFVFQVGNAQVLGLEVVDADSNNAIVGVNASVGLGNVMARGNVDVGVAVNGPGGQVTGQIHINMTYTPPAGQPQQQPPQQPQSQPNGMPQQPPTGMMSPPVHPGQSPLPNPMMPPQQPQQMQPHPQQPPPQMQSQPQPQQQPPPMTHSAPPPQSQGPLPPPAGPTPAGVLELTVIEGQNIRSPDNGKCEPFVMVSIGSMRLKTNTCNNNSPNPVFNHPPLRFDIAQGLHTAQIEAMNDIFLPDASLGHNPNVSLLPFIQNGKADFWIDLLTKRGEPAGKLHLGGKFRSTATTAPPVQPPVQQQAPAPVLATPAPTPAPAPSNAGQLHHDGGENHEQLKAEVMRQRVLLLAMTQKSTELKDHLREARDRMRAQAAEQEQREVELQSRISQLERAINSRGEDQSQSLTRARLAGVIQDSIKHMEERDQARRELEVERERRLQAEAKMGNSEAVVRLQQELADTKSRLQEAHLALERLQGEQHQPQGLLSSMSNLFISAPPPPPPQHSSNHYLPPQSHDPYISQSQSHVPTVLSQSHSHIPPPFHPSAYGAPAAYPPPLSQSLGPGSFSTAPYGSRGY